MKRRALQTIGKAVGARLRGGRPGALRSCGASVVAGVAAAVVTYRALRSGGG